MGLPELPQIRTVFELNSAYVGWCEAGDRMWDMALLRARSVVVPAFEVKRVTQEFDEAHSRLIKAVSRL